MRAKNCGRIWFFAFPGNSCCRLAEKALLISRACSTEVGQFQNSLQNAFGLKSARCGHFLQLPCVVQARFLFGG